MRLTDWAVAYAVLGVVCAVLASRARPGLTRSDVGLTAVLWPLYVPVLLASPTTLAGRRDVAATGESTDDEVTRLEAAVLAVNDEALHRLLPSRAQLDALRAHLDALDRRIVELAEAITAERAGRGHDDGAVRDGIARLVSMRQRHAAERAELAALCTRLRVQITVLRFAGSSADDVHGLAAELVARVEGASEAFLPPRSHAEGSAREEGA